MEKTYNVKITGSETKDEIIREIRKIVNEQGLICIGDVEGAECPILNKPNKDSETLIEKIGLSGVQCTEYVHGIEVNEMGVGYFDLTEEQLSDLLTIAEDYKTDNDKTWERCQS